MATTTKKPDEPAKPTYNETLSSITGYEEVDVQRRFGAHIDDLHFSMGVRALMYLTRVRGGMEKQLAYDQVMGAPAKQFEDEFSTDPEAEQDVDPDAPVSAEGNGSTAAA